MFMKNKGFKYICAVLVMTLLLPMCSITASASQDKDQKKVRIGYMFYDGYQNGGEGEPKSGSAYEYYQKIKAYTDWEYEYVYGSFNDLLSQLERGEIDIISCVTYTEERAKRFLFSEESHGSETYYLYIRVDDEEITPAQLSTLNGKNVGVTMSSSQEIYFYQWCEKNNISCNIVSYEYIEDLHHALDDGEIDAMVSGCVHESETGESLWKSIYRFTSEPLYFAVSKTRPDLLEELNDVQAYIVSADEYYTYESMKKYHNGLSHHNTYLTPQQQRYIENSSAIKVGYLEGTNPLSFTDSETGEMSGLAADYLNMMSQTYGIAFETYIYYDEYLLIDDLLSKKLDVILPLGMGYSAAEELNVALSTSICSLPMTAIYKNSARSNIFNRVAVNSNSLTQDGYVKQFYPNAEIYYVSNTKEALDAVENGLADVYFIRSSSLEYLNQKFHVYGDFHTMSVRDDMEAFMATRTEDTILSIILDKGISLLSDTQREAAMFQYTYEIGKTSLWQAMKENKEIVFALGVIIVLTCVALVAMSRLQSNKKHLKMLLVEKEKAEKAEKAKTEFLSQMSHDIRTPMNAIIGFTNFIKEENNMETIKEDYVPKIEMASNHLLMLINDVLEMSRIDTGKLVFQNEVHDIKSILDSVTTVMRMQAETKGIVFSSEISVKDRLVICDQNQMSRVLMNLLSNAVKFTPKGGRVSVSLHQKEESPEGFASYVATVSDTGIGMEPEFMERVFEPFERERTSTVSGMQGTGLGMAIVKNIVEAARGTIEVESVKGEGTVFTLNFTLKLGDKEMGYIPQESQGEKRYTLEELKEYFKGRRILLVEDNEFNSTIAYVVLENAGFLVETAENGQEAVHKVIDAPVSDYYDVILMDIQMPIMNGYEATKAIRGLKDERSKVKIIAVTANAFESDREAAAEAGMDGHVPKPLDVDLLYKTLLEITEKN